MPTDLLSYILAFCRITIILVFSLSFVSKIRDIATFEKTIDNFNILPKKISNLAAWLFLSSEAVVVILALLGGDFLYFSFQLAVLLLTIFCAAFISVLVRKIKTTCNCFGQSDKLVSVVDVWRNVGFIVCAFVGWNLLSSLDSNPLSFIEWGFITVIAIALIAIWLHLSEIVGLFRQA